MGRKIKTPSKSKKVYDRLDQIAINRLPDGLKWEGFKGGDPRVEWKKAHGDDWEDIPLMDLMFENTELEALLRERNELENKIRQLKKIENAKATIEVRKGKIYANTL